MAKNLILFLIQIIHIMKLPLVILIIKYLPQEITTTKIKALKFSILAVINGQLKNFILIARGM